MLVCISIFRCGPIFTGSGAGQSRIRQLVEQGDARAKIVEHLLSDLSRRRFRSAGWNYPPASLSLGYLGEVTLAKVAGARCRWRFPSPWAVHGGAHGLLCWWMAFGLLTILQVVLGELVPKSLSLARAERVALLIARPFQWFLNTFRWAIDLLDRFAEKIVLALGVVAPHSHTLVRSTEELR